MKVEINSRKDGKSIITLEELHFTFQGEWYIVPAGYASDGASVPRLLWRLLSPCIDPVTLAPSICHDFLYEWGIGTRYEADEWYMDALYRAGYPAWKCILTFIGIRLFGGSHYGN